MRQKGYIKAKNIPALEDIFLWATCVVVAVIAHIFPVYETCYRMTNQKNGAIDPVPALHICHCTLAKTHNKDVGNFWPHDSTSSPIWPYSPPTSQLHVAEHVSTVLYL